MNPREIFCQVGKKNCGEGVHNLVIYKICSSAGSPQDVCVTFPAVQWQDSQQQHLCGGAQQNIWDEFQNWNEHWVNSLNMYRRGLPHGEYLLWVENISDETGLSVMDVDRALEIIQMLIWHFGRGGFLIHSEPVCFDLWLNPENSASHWLSRGIKNGNSLSSVFTTGWNFKD